MRTWAPLILPLAILLAVPAFLGLCPQSALWAQSAALPATAVILYGVVFLLGAFFGQSRLSFVALLCVISGALVHYSFFLQSDKVKGETVIMLSMVYLPALTALFYRLDERGMFSVQGGVRGVAIVLSASLVLFLLPRLQALNEALAGPATAVPGAPAMPLIGCLAFAAAAPFLLVRRRHESPLMGPVLCCAVLCFFLGLTFGSSVWRAEQRATVFLMWNGATAVVLGWAVMESLWRHANFDDLTELPGRRSLKRHFDRLNIPYAIAVADLDRFKKINDHYGHDTGDQVLRFTASRLKRIRLGKVYRHGGEEFAIVYEGDNFGAFVNAVEDVRADIQDGAFGIRRKGRPRRKPQAPRTDRGNTHKAKVTVSFGVAAWNPEIKSPFEVMQAADEALYRAKRAGRNRLSVSE